MSDTSARKKVVTAIAAAELFLAALMVVAPATFFPVCESPMHCYYSFMAEIGVAAVIAVAAVLSIFSKGLVIARWLSLVTAVCGVLAILYPTTLIGVCGSTTHPCHYGALPIWNLSGVGIIILSAACFFAAREGSD